MKERRKTVNGAQLHQCGWGGTHHESTSLQIVRIPRLSQLLHLGGEGEAELLILLRLLLLLLLLLRVLRLAELRGAQL